MAREGAEQDGFAIVNSVNPYRLWGQRSAAWEICDELGAPPTGLSFRRERGQHQRLLRRL